jgi:hypothetical protein
MKRQLVIVAFAMLAGNCFAQPSNDNCFAAISLNVLNYCNPTLGNSSTATSSNTSCAGLADDDLWYSFVATKPDITIIGYSGGNGFDPVLEFYTNCGTSVQCQNNFTGTNGEEMN